MESMNLSSIKRKRMLEYLEKIRKELSSDPENSKIISEIENELEEKKYGLNWEEHEEKVDIELKYKIPVFREMKNKQIQVNSDLKYNFLIEGDNLHCLYLLQKTHKHSIDVIYIDPPYNTGNEDFIYNDNYIDKEDSFKHSKWLSFMHKRISLAKQLLSKTGVMFIHIDEHEVAQLKMLCDELFTENNVDVVIWQKNDSKVDRNTNSKIIHRFKNIHEYLIICYRNKADTKFNKMMKLPSWKNKQKNQDNDPRGPWSSGIISFNEGHKNEDKNSPYYYTVKTPSGKEYTRHWFVLKHEFEELRADNRIHFPRNGSGVPRLKTFENEEKEYYMESILRGVGTSSSAKDELAEILGDREAFDTPKPVKLVKEMIRIASNKNSIILDFFAGSGTTGQAVLELNKEDNGNRKFILCTNNEIKPIRELDYIHNKGYMLEYNPSRTVKSKTIKNKIDDFMEKNKEIQNRIFKETSEYEDYGICRDITYPRLKTVITGVKKDGTEYLKKTEQNMKYYKIEYINRYPEDNYLSNELQNYIVELIQLENGIDKNDKSIYIAFDNEKLEKFLREGNLAECKVIYKDMNILLSNKEVEIIEKNRIKCIDIPEYYFKNEIMEANEW